jgi:hypothetical protein
MSQLPAGQNERRQDCIDHENRIDEVAAEVHKHGGWFKVIGGGLGFAFIVLGWFGSSINSKLDAIQATLNKTDIAIENHRGRIENCEKDIKDIQERHKYFDQNGIVKKVR